MPVMDTTTMMTWLSDHFFKRETGYLLSRTIFRIKVVDLEILQIALYNLQP